MEPVELPRRVLIANRGEIATRIARAATALGIESVAVYPPADELSLHTRVADQACELPVANTADPVAAYLGIDALIEVAIAAGCDCVHPGYGFLSESPAFAGRVAAAGMTFVGPSPDALMLFGDKVAARAIAERVGVPTIPGSRNAVVGADEAATVAAEIGYPVMLKAAAGGGGRGIRRVDSPDELGPALERCASEAEAAFGDPAVFVEKLIDHPRHIEVQVLGDVAGTVVHLWERDCSVQLRNQKVVEIAPAPALDPALRQRILDDAVRLVDAADYVNAGTVEFLVAPEAGEHYFIECNPRIQVEHTVTEQVTGTDLVQAQFLLAAGASLASLGLGDQATIAPPRGYSIQARVVARGAGTISAYKEPSGVGVRVDGNGYLGYTPPPQFDPLLAKVVASSSGFALPTRASDGAEGADGPEPAFVAAVTRARAALEEFHVAGLPTNLEQLVAILSHPAVLAGDARTTLLADESTFGAATSGMADSGGRGGPSGPMDLLTQQSTALGRDASLGAAAAPLAEVAAAANTRASTAVADGAAGGGLTVGEGERAVECPLGATVVEVKVDEGDRVAAGQTLVVISAMKMETEVTAPVGGTVSGVGALEPGDTVVAGQLLAVLEPSIGSPDPASSNGAGGPGAEGESSWAATLDEIRTLQRLADERLSPSSDEPGVVRQRNRGKLHCRERIALLLDDGSFREIGSVAGFASYGDEGGIVAFTPANHVGGSGTIEGRPAIVCADDFTSRGGHSDGAIGAKSFHLDQLSVQLGVPSIRLLDGSSGGGSVASMVPEQKKEGESKAKESTGAISSGRPRVAGGGGSFLPGHLGSTEYAEQLATVPVVNMLLGSVVGIGAAKAVLGHFSVMVRDIAQLFVAGPPVVSHAMGYDITKEDLGDWRIHCRNGSVDNLAETEEEAMDMTRRFLSYLPSNVYEAPPVTAPRTDDPPDRREDELFTLIPRKRTTTFDMRRAIELMADRDSFFEIGPLWGTDQIVGFARFNGYPVGVIASDSRHVNGGALTADGCDKLTRHLDLCDLFHLPVLNLCDNPGFAVGLEHEVAGTIRKGGEWMIAFAQTKVPIFTVLLRRSFGVAGNNYATPRREPGVRVVWPAADVGGIPPEGGIEAAYKRQLAEAADPVALRAELEARIESARGPLGPLSRFQMEEMIDPRDTRAHICAWMPQAHRLVAQPRALVQRPHQFRP